MSLGAGARIGPFEIVGALGAGGMGEVYRARDTKLGREVALKVLPDTLASDPERRARFEREARTLAALNHPNIAAIHGFEEADGIRALVLELVEGPTLADRIAAGPIPLADALPIARQIAEALDAPHEQGIVHRDLKPANIKLRPDGAVKVLDFGLAKLVEPERSGPLSELKALSPTFTSPAVSQVGVILGTAAYMAPEQARGRVVDKRADIWAFGCVLFEMLSGKAAFGGDDVSQILARVIERDVDWSALPATVPPELRALLRRCLQKDPRQRLRDIGDVRLALEDAREGDGATVATHPPPARTRRHVLAAALVSLLLVAGTGLAVWMFTRPAAPEVTRLTIATPEGATVGGGNADPEISLSPDGRRVAFRPNGRDGLYVRDLDQLDPRLLASAQNARTPFFSPDGNWIGYFTSRDRLSKVPATGGPPVTVSELPGSNNTVEGPNPRGAAWLEGDTIVFATTGPDTGLFKVSASGGTPEVLTRPNRDAGEGDHYWPAGLPGGHAVLFTIVKSGGAPENTALTLADARIAVLDLRTGAYKVVIHGGTYPRYVSSGHLVFSHAGTLRAVPFDLDRLEVQGDPTAVLEGVVTKGTGAVNYDVARNGSLLYVAGGFDATSNRGMAWVDRQGRIEVIDAPRRTYVSPRLSPDGTRVAVHSADQDRDILVWHFGRQTLTRLTVTPEPEVSPVWTPDGKYIVFARNNGIFQKPADGAGTEERLVTDAERSIVPSGFVPDGSRLLLRFATRDGANGLSVLNLTGNRQIEPLVSSTFGLTNASLSPNGRWVAYQSSESGQFEVWVRPFPDIERGQWQITTTGGSRPVWAGHGRELFYVDNNQMMVVPVQSGSTFEHEKPRPLFPVPDLLSAGAARSFDVTPDGQRFLILQRAAAASELQLVLVQNWLEDVKRLTARK